MRLLALIGLGFLCGCSSGTGGTERIAAAAMESLRASFGSDKDDKPKGRRLTREAIEASGAAMIRASLVGEDVRSILSAATDNGGYVTYVSQLGQQITMRGTLVTAVRGIGYDLLSVEASAEDPFVTPRPVEEWPATVRRIYTFPDFRPEGRQVEVICRYQQDGPQEIAIVGITYQGIQLKEFCEGEEGGFQNLIFADAETGFVWRSLQWLGPDQGSVDIEVLEPFTPDEPESPSGSEG